MKLKFFPREEKFFEDFSRQGKIIEEAARILLSTFNDYGNLPQYVEKIEALEHQGDEIVHETANRMNKIFVTPIDREDIHELCTALDDVLDYIWSATTRLVLFDVKKPAEPAVQLAAVILQSAETINKALSNLQHFKSVQYYTDQIREYEKTGDHINRDAMGELFKGELPVIDVIRWQEIYEHLEAAIDRCEDIARIIDGISLKHS